MRVWVILLLWCCVTPLVAQESVDTHPLSDEHRAQLRQQLQMVLEQHPAADATPAVRTYSRRGDAQLFLGQFAEAVDSYQQMVKRQPDLDASHWRLGIALFFADQPQAAAGQFDRYHSFDDVDRENGIWRYLSHYRAYGAERAARELLKYEKDDREPFPVVYRLFDGSLTPEAARQLIPKNLSAAERDKQVFYLELYIGLLHVVRQETSAAKTALHRAVSCQWPRSAGFGPNYMWHVARVQYDLLMTP